MGENKLSNSQTDILVPENFLRAALTNDQGALNKFRDEFRKLSEPDKAKLADDAHYMANVMSGEAEKYPETRVDDPGKHRVARVRPIFDSEGTMIDFDVATFTMKNGIRSALRESKEDLKIHDLLDSGTTAGAKIDEAQELENKVAPFANACLELERATTLTDDGFTGMNKFWRSVKKNAFEGYQTDKYVYEPLSARERDVFYQNFLKTLDATVPPGTLDETMLAELYRQSMTKPFDISRASEQVIKDFGLSSPHRAHDGDIYNATRLTALPAKLEERVKASIDVHEQFWRNAKYSGS